MKAIRVVVNGAWGRMGQEVLAAVCRDPELEAVGAVELNPTDDYLPLPDNSGQVPISSDTQSILVRCRPDVLVDFTIAQAAMPAARLAAKNGVNLVIGTTGLSAEDIAELGQLSRAHGIGAVVAPNFALGAVVMIHLAKIAARFFDYADIIEMHHEQKADAPSGTALATARDMAQARGRPFHQPPVAGESVSASRGGQIEGISLHSVRLPGLVAHQEVILGGVGQTLKIRHDTISRECFMPGVVLAIKEVVKGRGFVYGLDSLLGL